MEVSALTAAITKITELLTAFVGWLASMTTALIGNDFVIILLGIFVALLVFGLVMGLVSRIRGRKRRK